MYPHITHSGVRRNIRGSTAEFAPALVILFVLFFPLIDLLAILPQYGFAWYLNYLQTREAARTVIVQESKAIGASQAKAQDVVNKIRVQWRSTGIGAFTDSGASMPPDTINVSETGSPPSVSVITRVSIKPFLRLPLPPIPGLSAPVAVSITSSRPIELVR